MSNSRIAWEGWRGAVRGARATALAAMIAALAACGGRSAPRESGRLWYAGSRAICGFTPSQLTTGSDENPAILVTSGATTVFSDVALDEAGDVWATDSDGDELLRFPAASLKSSGRVEPDLVLRSSALHRPGNLAFDRDGRLWVANRPIVADGGCDAGSILRFDALPTSGGTQEIGPSLRLGAATREDLLCLGAIAFDASGNLWATSYAGILRFDDPGGLSGDVALAPGAVISVAGYENYSFYTVAFDAGGALWAAAQTGGFNLTSVVKFTDPGSLSGVSRPDPAVVIEGEPELFPAGGLAFDAEGDLWLATADAVLEYADPGALSGAVNPAPAMVLSVRNEAAPSLYGHLVFFPGTPGVPVYP